MLLPSIHISFNLLQIAPLGLNIAQGKVDCRSQKKGSRGLVTGVSLSQWKLKEREKCEQPQTKERRII